MKKLLFPTLIVCMISGCASTPQIKHPLPDYLAKELIAEELIMDTCLNLNHWHSSEYGIIRYLFNSKRQNILSNYIVDENQLEYITQEHIRQARKALVEKPNNLANQKEWEIECKKVSGDAKTNYNQLQEAERNRASQPIIINRPVVQSPTPIYRPPTTTFCNGVENMQYCSSF